MERGQRRTPQQTRTGQPQRRPAQSSRTSRPTQPPRSANRKRRKNKSKKPWIIGAAVVLLIIIIAALSGGSNGTPDNVKTNDVAGTGNRTNTVDSQHSDMFPAIVYDDNSVKVTVTGYDPNDIMGKEIEYTFENNSNVSIMLGIGDAYIDGWKITTIGGNTLEPGTKTTGSIYLSEEELKQSGIAGISSITIKECNIWNDESYEIIDTFDMTVNLK